jgi:hypothetical protein
MDLEADARVAVKKGRQVVVPVVAPRRVARRIGEEARLLRRGTGDLRFLGTDEDVDVAHRPQVRRVEPLSRERDAFQ